MGKESGGLGWEIVAGVDEGWTRIALEDSLRLSNQGYVLDIVMRARFEIGLVRVRTAAVESKRSLEPYLQRSLEETATSNPHGRFFLWIGVAMYISTSLARSVDLKVS